ncbi:AEC family transporter [Colwellia sp. M166]|uniref:AEC family transporter n=1 Tax=Colwellia sp. M166 TaxID=2583805 RepID=UPI00211DFCE6|nr:AEC family transporter [Colwellia sp. M166]UUO21883.1 AEC family transporter [Colwellia sp. M166]|tara:strand:+ start:675 stop:1589 length:915 start_codon:yes stop_codon:yes gene_type:complete
MIIFITALIPIMILIMLGFILKRIKFLPEETWPGMEKLTYFVLFPALLIRTLGKQSLAGAPWPSMLIIVVGTIMTSAVMLIVFRKVLSKNNATFTSIFQGGVRFNTYITLAIAQSLYGATGLAMSSVAAGFMIVLINLWCISVFVIWGKGSFQGVLQFIKEIVGNPLIIGCTIGWFISLSGIGLPIIVEDILEIVGRAALPFGLLAVGAALKLEGIKGHFSPIVLSSIAQFGLKPLVTAAFVSYTGLTGVAAAVLIIAFMTPTAPSAYILSRQLGGDTEAMASIITVQTLIAFLIMPLLGTLLL